MALIYGVASLQSKPSPPTPLLPKHRNLFFKLSSSQSPPPANQLSSSFRAAARSEGTGGGVKEEDPPDFTVSFSSAQTQLDLLEQLTSTSSSSDGYESDGSSLKPTIRDQLSQLVGDREGEDFSIPLGKNLKKVSPKFLTISQKRNIKRQAYLNEVSQRNDTVFFATIGAFVILPPLVILGIAVLTGYVQFFP
ncbi:PREDICTED: uncharacterized protein LOC104610246 [Nelumbo nucifera]|uniref:Uncharacterized protein n=2 Tax=Nelumbo nucifera TaxID=4432 RepID=A0A822YMV2_NELNU|nr:PREDICTED: uncharacterized protein LOC104610246 [Nelumbo nucifera]DAD33852.1 TPA_asm: hypothetical protein HUJ06_012703 [Nelumbo nucifera]